jgi:hypothetical protein
VIEENLVAERKLAVNLTPCSVRHGRSFFLHMLACALTGRAAAWQLGWQRPVPVAIFGGASTTCNP